MYDGLAVAASPVAARAPDPVPAMTAVHMTPKHYFFNINILSAKNKKTLHIEVEVGCGRMLKKNKNEVWRQASRNAVLV